MKNAMKNNGLMLLAVAITVTSVTGCGCCRRLRDTLCRGAYCGAPAAALPAPLAPPVGSPAPLADVGCGFNPVAYDAGCGFDPMVQTYGYNGFPAGGQMMGSPMMMDGGCPLQAAQSTSTGDLAAPRRSCARGGEVATFSSPGEGRFGRPRSVEWSV